MNNKKDVDVCLVMPPLTVLNQPSMALGALKGTLVDAGISCYVDYASVYFLNALGEEIVFSLFSADRNDFIAEYLFAESAGIQVSKTLEETIKRYTGGTDPLKDIQIQKNILKAKEVATDQINITVKRILDRNPRIVGCTITFLQRNAAIAILKKIKEQDSQIITILGGVGCAGDAGIEMMRIFSWIDFVFFGESDDIFAPVIRNLLDGGDDPLPYGVLKNGDRMPECAPHRIVKDMNQISYPDFDEFFELMGMPESEELHKMSRGYDMVLTAETSRGCWWGQKHACSFCGINGAHNIYRQKAPKRIADEIQYMYQRYGVSAIQFTDCVIPQSLPDKLIELLKHDDFSHQFYGEVRSNINEIEMKKYVEAGFTQLQPGIESLSDHVLYLMRKGVSAIQNIATLKFARKFDVKLFWNLLVDFPGETVEDYTEQMKRIPLIEHLMPPTGMNPIVFVKDSVYYRDQEKYNLKLEPSDIYNYMAPCDLKYIEAIAYNYTDKNRKKSVIIEKASQQLDILVKDWQKNFAKDWKYKRKKYYGLFRLDMQSEKDFVMITDTRSCRRKRIQVYSGIMKDILIYCKEPVQYQELSHHFEKNGKAFDHAVSILKEMMVLLVINDWYLTIAVEESRKTIVETNIMEYMALLEKNPKRNQRLRTAIQFRLRKGEDKYFVIGDEMSKDARKEEIIFDAMDVMMIDRLL